MEKYNTSHFGLMLQTLNPNKIVSISWGEGDEEDDHSPTFYFFSDVGEVSKMLRSTYSTPFVFSDANDDVYTKENAVLKFDSVDLEIKIIAYKTSGDVYKFFNPQAYQYLQQNLLQGAIPWSEYVEM